MKNILITGGTQGIGAAIARLFYKEGMRVTVGARQDNGLAKKLGARARFVAMDVRREEDHLRAVEVAAGKGKLDAYINCAGFSGWRSLGNVDAPFVDEMIDTNLKGVLWGCKAASKYLSKGGSIINISSLAGKRGSANNAVYCASKFGVTALTQSLAKELGPQGIRVNAVCPVYITTDGVLAALKSNEAPPAGKDVQLYLKKFAKEQCALGRLPTADEVAAVCLFLASSQASAITGQSINVDCGTFPQ